MALQGPLQLFLSFDVSIDLYLTINMYWVPDTPNSLSRHVFNYHCAIWAALVPSLLLHLIKNTPAPHQTQNGRHKE